MYRSLYPFKKTHHTSLSFNQGDVFIELSGASGDKNWYYVIASNGDTGYIPKNYVIVERVNQENLNKHLDTLKDKVRLKKVPDKEKSDLLANLEGVKKKFKSESQKSENSIPIPNSGSPPVVTSPLSVSPKSTTSSGRSTPPKSGKKRAAPPPPSTSSSSSPRDAPNSTIPDPEEQEEEPPKTLPPKLGVKSTNSNNFANSPERRVSLSTTRRQSLVDPTAEQVRAHARDVVELVRVETGLSHGNSQSVVHTVLQYVCTNLHRLDKNIPALLNELEFPLLSDVSDIASSADTKLMEQVFEQLTICKEDDQQRNWMLYEDEVRIHDLLQNLSNCLTNSDRSVSSYVLSRYKYFYVHSLVEYFQMETRWLLRRLLIENFMMMCSLEPVIVSLMLSSVLPLELAQDMFQNTENIERFRACALMLTVIFSHGEPMPVHYFDQLGTHFVNFMLEYIEGPPNNDHEQLIPDVLMGLALSYNLQFPDINTNVMVSCLASRPGAKVWCEKLLLLLNREEDPCAIIGRIQGSMIPHSVHKMVLDMFIHESCHQLFYTNDFYVLIDIIVRQLADLDGMSPIRRIYIRMCRLVLLNTDYTEHLHRFKDFERIFIRILDDDEEVEEDKRLIEGICRDVHAFNSLAP